MSWVAIGLSLTCVGLAIKMMLMKSRLTKASLLLKAERAKTEALLSDYKDLVDRADERVKQLKGRVNDLLEEKIENSKPGDMLRSLNSLLSDGEG